MSLTMGTGPFGHVPMGRFNFDVPRTDVMFVEPSPRWIRARLGGRTVVDSRRARMLHEHARLARYFFPREDVDWDGVAGIAAVEPPAGAPGLENHVAFPFDAIDEWLEEDEEIVAHAPDPYHRIDVRPTSRHVRISIGGVSVADSHRARALFESNLPTRWYLPREDVIAQLQPSTLQTMCAYKGAASYLSVRVADDLVENIAWTYPQPRHDAARVRDLVCFFNEAVDLDLDGRREVRPMTPWGRPGWWRTLVEER
jgi:uncharacterized protein (DUF427 family)